MIIKLDIKFDIQKLREELERVIAEFPPNMKKNGPWGGWSITSSDGSIHDGWQTGEKVNDPTVPKDEINSLREFFSTNEFTTPTPLYRGYFKEVIQLIERSIPGIKLSRIRIAVLEKHPEEDAYWHVDGDQSSGENAFRLHIPLITNEQCFFDYEDSRHHLPADGSAFLVLISKRHRAVNLSEEKRYHIIMNVSYHSYDNPEMEKDHS